LAASFLAEHVGFSAKNTKGPKRGQANPKILSMR
jgi:hypothetical protein